MSARRSGSEPATARSALGLRTWLASFGVVVSVLAAGMLGAAAQGSSGADRTVFTVLALVALLGVVAGVVDLVVLARRRRSSGPGGSQPPGRTSR